MNDSHAEIVARRSFIRYEDYDSKLLLCVPHTQISHSSTKGVVHHQGGEVNLYILP